MATSSCRAPNLSFATIPTIPDCLSPYHASFAVGSCFPYSREVFLCLKSGLYKRPNNSVYDPAEPGSNNTSKFMQCAIPKGNIYLHKCWNRHMQQTTSKITWNWNNLYFVSAFRLVRSKIHRIMGMKYPVQWRYSSMNLHKGLHLRNHHSDKDIEHLQSCPQSSLDLSPCL